VQIGPFKLSAVVLAAGASTRMGRPKMLLPWGSKSILAHSVQTWERLGVSVAIVWAGKDEGIEAELERMSFPEERRIVNRDPGRGMFSSIQTAAQWTGWDGVLTHWAIVLGDQPHLKEATLRRVIEFANEFPDDICQPSYKGRARHPVVIPRELFFRLRDCEELTLKDFLQRHAPARRLVEIDDPGLDLDLDRPEDYERAVQMFPPQE